MAYNVKFLKGLSSALPAVRDAQTFYYTTDTSQLYLGDVKLSNQPEITAAIERIATAEGKITTLENAVGTIANLTTTERSNLVAAINELVKKVANVQTTGAVTMTESTPEGYAKAYTIKQGETTVGTINIPKDMVVKSGALVVNPEGEDEGTYIELTLANATDDKIYINVKDLIDIYTAAESATEVQLAVTTGGVISASLVDGGVTAAKLANDAVTTDKIANANVTRAKLAADVEAVLVKAESAVQSVVEGDAAGEIKVDGIAVKVHGLGSAAYENTDAFDAAGAAAAVLGNADTDTAESNTVYGIKKRVDDKDTAMNARVEALETAVGEGGSVDSQIDTKINELDADITSAAPAETGKGIQVQVVETDGKVSAVNVSGNFDNSYDAKGAAAAAQAAAATDAQTKANTAETNAKAYTDEALTWGSF